jgi:hypothetical protein
MVLSAALLLSIMPTPAAYCGSRRAAGDRRLSRLAMALSRPGFPPGLFGGPRRSPVTRALARDPLTKPLREQRHEHSGRHRPLLRVVLQEPRHQDVVEVLGDE